MKIAASLDELRAAAVLSPLDLHLAGTLERVAAEREPLVLLAAALASREVAAGNVCLDLRRRVREPLAGEGGEAIAVDWPAAEEWIAALRRSPCVGRGDDAESRPLVLDAAGRLYLQRYWRHQERLARAIRTRVGAATGAVPAALLRALFDGNAPPGSSGPDWQRVAAVAALGRRFCVVSGGPGTGKTFTVVKILALLVRQALDAGRRPPRILLAAPTGKAAARLRESIQQSLARLELDDDVRAAIPADASTVHRLLGARPHGAPRFLFDREQPLAVDVVLVDEASMIDLALMARLVDALPEKARLILLGDKDQLASVEAGAVLGDICNTGAEIEHSQAFAAEVERLTGDVITLSGRAPRQSGMSDSVVRLTHSFRFRDDSGIGGLARAINAGDVDAAVKLLSAPGDELEWIQVGEREAQRRLLDLAETGFGPYLEEREPALQLGRLADFRILCAHRRGLTGTEAINRDVERHLRLRGFFAGDESDSYRGRPLMVTSNDYQLELFNGDIGVIGEVGEVAAPVGPASARRAAFFQTGDGSQTRTVALSRLPAHETVFAMTVHKSQGSEFAHVAIVLPERTSPVLTRELLYTAVSRARSRVTLFASGEVLARAIEQRVSRASGLRDALWD